MPTFTIDEKTERHQEGIKKEIEDVSIVCTNWT
jgi:hypothetical protein